MNILIGYIFIGLYLGFLFLGAIVISKKMNNEVSRKITHISLFFVWVLIEIFFKDTIHQIIVPLGFTLVNFITYKFSLFKMIERKEDKYPGTIYFALAMSVIMTVSYFIPQLFYFSGIAFFALTFGDGCASLCGKYCKSWCNFDLRYTKTFNGFIGCFLGTFAGLMLFKVLFMNELNPLIIISLAYLCAVLELVEKGFDNFSITLIIFPVSYLLVTNPIFQITLIVGLIIFTILYFGKVLKYYWSLLLLTLIFLIGFIV